MTRHSLKLCALMASALLASTTSAVADQTDQRLDQLFDTLKITDDVYQGASITRKIWEIWRQTENSVAHDLMGKGIKEMTLQRYTEALESFSQVVDQAPQYAEGWNKRATLYYLIGDYGNSIEDIKRTLELEPRHFGAMSGLGLIYMQLDQEETALEAFQSALKMNPHLMGAQQNIEAIQKHLSGEEI
ncbi:MAG: tetratricopeptide repeat protein [Gammaproteobacteria bacterium]|nr:tetratricopeptide repeat protein [Gammaproteobacteria bacterium]